MVTNSACRAGRRGVRTCRWMNELSSRRCRGVSTRRYARSFEPLSEEVEVHGINKSAISEWFVIGTQRRLAELMRGDLPSGGGSKGSIAARGKGAASGERSACDATTAFAPTVGKPCEGELHVRFDEGAVETGRRAARPGHSPERGETARGRRAARATAPLLRYTETQRH
jgi:hypothetical protein